MKFFMFHLMPWPYLPADFEERHRSAWVTCPNTYYDAIRPTKKTRHHYPELTPLVRRVKLLHRKMNIDSVY